MIHSQRRPGLAAIVADREGSASNEEGISGMRVKMPHKAATVTLWVMALALMGWDTLDGEYAAIGRWALLVGMGAMTWTLAQVANHCRKVVLEVMSWEHWMMDKVKGGEQERAQNVRAIR